MPCCNVREVVYEQSKGLNSVDLPEVRWYLTCMLTTISSKGQIVLPVELRNLDRIEAGQEFAIERIEPGEYLLKKLPRGDSSGLVDWLLSCPDKGWFELLPSESTDSL